MTILVCWNQIARVQFCPISQNYCLISREHLILVLNLINTLLSMRRLFTLIKKITILTPNEQAGLRSWLRKKELLPRERLGEDIPSGSWIFVEEGFLLLLQREKKEWVCKNFYYEGVSTTVYNVGSAELEEKSFNVQAVEKSTISRRKMKRTWRYFSRRFFMPG